MVNVEEIKLKILSSINERGPSLPVHVSKSVGIEPMLASAILSELIKEKKIRLSNLRVGSSPLYLIPGQEEKLQNFVENLNHVEKEAFVKLKDNKVLDDEKQEPKIRVALRQIKDFAIPIQYKGKTFWKFFSVSDEKVKESIAEEQTEIAIGERVIGQKIIEEIQKEKEYEIKEKELEIKKQRLLEIEQEIKNIKESKVEQIKELEKPIEIITLEKPTNAIKIKKEDKFLDEIKSILVQKSIELVSVEHHDKKQVIAKIRFISAPEQIVLLFAFDKKRPEEKELIKAFRKAQIQKLPYYVLCRGEISKKMKDSMDAYKSLIKIDKI